MSLAARVMSANRLATDGRSWSRLLALNNGGTSSRQWLAVDPRIISVWLVEQLPGFTHAVDYSKHFGSTGFVACTGAPISEENRKVVGAMRDAAVVRSDEVSKRQVNLTVPKEVAEMMRGRYTTGEDYSNNSTATMDRDLNEILAFRGDVGSQPFPVGVIDTKVLTAGLDGVETFEAISGPSFSEKIPAFNWSKSFPNEPHCGHPEVFNFDMTTPTWVWV